MDNLFELLIFLFVIYSILSPILNKKKQQNAGRKIPSRNTGDAQTKTSPQPSARDIFEEMIGFKIPKNDEGYGKTVPQSSRTVQYEMPSVDYDTDLKVEYKDLETSQKMPDIDFDKLTTAEINQIKKKEQVIEQPPEIYKQFNPPNKKAVEIKKKLTNPNSFREIFIISEILNKPKALRR